MWELGHKEGWMLKNWCFLIVVLERTLDSLPWTARRSNQSMLKEINPEYSLEGLMLKRQYSGHLTWTADSLEKTLMLGKTEGNRRRGWQRLRWLDGITDSNKHDSEETLGDSRGQKSLACFSPWGHRVKQDLVTKQQQDPLEELVAQVVKHLPTMREIQVQSLGQEDHLEKEMATHSSTLAWKIPWTEEPGRLQSMGSQRAEHDWATSLSLSFHQKMMSWWHLQCCLTATVGCFQNTASRANTNLFIYSRNNNRMSIVMPVIVLGYLE